MAKRCVRIEVEYDNGEVWIAEGEAAELIRNALLTKDVELGFSKKPPFRDPCFDEPE